MLAVFTCFIIAKAAGDQNAPPKRPPTLAEQASKLYTSAMSQYRDRHWKQAEGLLKKFVKTYPSHEYVPAAYLELAYCREQLKDFAGWEKSLDTVIKRFWGSPAWFMAYAARMKRAKELKENDKYLKLLTTMSRRVRELPFRMYTQIGWSYWNYEYYNYRLSPLRPKAAEMDIIIRKPGWIMDVVEMADTPIRARRAISALQYTFKKYSKELPPDWQYARVALMKKAGLTAQAENALKKYINEWGDDPRVVEIWLLKLNDAYARKDEKEIAKIIDYLVKNYKGIGSKCYFIIDRSLRVMEGRVARALAKRLKELYEADKYEQFTKLARFYLQTYTASYWRRRWIIDLWYDMAKKRAQGGDTSRIPSTLKMLDEFPLEQTPSAKRRYIARKIELYVLMKNFDQAVQLANELLGDKYYCAAGYNLIERYANRYKPFAKVLEKARAKWKIPKDDPTSPAAKLLENLIKRLKDDQIRHAEEIGEEMFAKYRSDASTIKAVKMLADYYFKKVIPEPRDKWMERMIETYPYHPLTESVLRNHITAERAAQRYKRLAEAIDTLLKRFPGVELDNTLYYSRLACYNAEHDTVGKIVFSKKYLGPRAIVGDIDSIDRIARCALAGYEFDKDDKKVGDYWFNQAKKLKNCARFYCLARAWYAYNRWNWHREKCQQDDRFSAVQTIIKMLREQQDDPELRWAMEFADINLLACAGKTREMLEKLSARLGKNKKYRDLSLRLNFSAIGTALGDNNMINEGRALANKLKKHCYTLRDKISINLMLARMFEQAKLYLPAAQYYLKVVEAYPRPARMFRYFRRVQWNLSRANSPAYPAKVNWYIGKIGRTQELIPGLLCNIGGYFLGKKNQAAAMSVFRQLASRYPASMGRDRLAKALFKQR